MHNKIKDDFFEIKLPKYADLPNINLYAEQVVSYLETQIGVLYTNDERITSSMISNYISQGILSPPINKKYSNDHIAFLILIFIFKQIYSINEIKSIISVHSSANYTIKQSYNYLATEFENILKATFNQENLPKDTTSTDTELRFFIRSSIIAYANKFYTLQLLEKYKK